MNPFSDSVINALMGVNPTNEILNLWYEISYLRFMVAKLVEHSTPHEGEKMMDHFSESLIEEARAFAQKIVKEKFPKVGVTFNKVQENEQTESKDG